MVVQHNSYTRILQIAISGLVNGKKILEWQLNVLGFLTHYHRKSWNYIHIVLIIIFSRLTAAESWRYLTAVGLHIFSSPSSSTHIPPPHNPALSHHGRDTHNTNIMHNIFCGIQHPSLLTSTASLRRLVPVHTADLDLCACILMLCMGTVDFEASIRKLCSCKLLLQSHRRCLRGG